MREAIQRLAVNPAYSKAVYWGKLISITGSAQLVVQGTGVLAGILIIRLLSTKEYALYTLANTMFGTMSILADSGISTGAMAVGGKVWQDKTKLGTVLATSLSLRKQFGILSLIITLPILAYLLLDHDAGRLDTVLIIAAIIPAFVAVLSDSLLEITPKLHQDIKPLQKNQVEVSLGRLFLSFVSLFFFPYTFVALIATSIPRIYGNWQLRKISARFANTNVQPDRLVRKEIRKSVNKTLPIVIYHCFSGQISIWLISFFGTTTNISQLGALGRLGMIFNLFTILFSTLVIPRYSRIEAKKKLLMKPFLLVQITTFSIGIILLLIVWLFSNQILWILGKNYSNLNYELLLVATGASIGLMENVCSQLVINRGWIPNPYFLIIINFLSTVISLVFFNLSSFVNVLYFNIIITLISYSIGFVFGLLKISRL